jgi:zinc protease
VLRQHFPAALEIVGDIVGHPTFPDDGVEEERRLQIASIRRSLDSAAERPFQMFDELFYGAHPYGLPANGTLASVQSITSDALQEWYRKHVVADDALLVIAGDIDAEAARTLCNEHFGHLPKSSELRDPIPQFEPPASRREVIEVRDRKQSAIVVGFPAVPPGHPDWMLLKLLGSVTSGLAGTFFAELRGKRSLAYTVYAGESSNELAGAFVGYIATDAAKEDEARAALIAEMQRLATNGFTEEDLERAKSYLAGVTRIRRQTNSALAQEIGSSLILGVGLDFTERFLDRIRTVSVAELREIAKRYLTHDNYSVAVLRGKS